MLRDTYSFAPDSFTNIAERSSNGGLVKEIIQTIATREKTRSSGSSPVTFDGA